MKSRIVLASNSPRRKEICIKYGLNPEIILPSIEEKSYDSQGPYETVMALAFEKAYSVAEKLESGKIVMAADTIVVYGGKKLGKPTSREDAKNMLNLLSGNKHSVITGICLIDDKKKLKVIDYVETQVKFKKLTDKFIDRYIDTEEPMDKSGSYGIQGWGQLLVEEINGSYLNVVGLPIEKISDLLVEYFNISLL